MTKYNNKKATLKRDGQIYSFDSRHEAKVFDNLYAQLKRGEIKDLVLQPEYELVPKQNWNGTTLRAVKYIADFRYIKNGITYVVDAKGFRTKDYIIKMKMFVYQNEDVVFLEV